MQNQRRSYRENAYELRVGTVSAAKLSRDMRSTFANVRWDDGDFSAAIWFPAAAEVKSGQRVLVGQQVAGLSKRLNSPVVVCSAHSGWIGRISVSQPLRTWDVATCWEAVKTVLSCLVFSALLIVVGQSISSTLGGLLLVALGMLYVMALGAFWRAAWRARQSQADQESLWRDIREELPALQKAMLAGIRSTSAPMPRPAPATTGAGKATVSKSQRPRRFSFSVQYGGRSRQARVG